METIIRKGKILLLVLAACCAVGFVRVDYERDLEGTGDLQLPTIEMHDSSERTPSEEIAPPNRATRIRTGAVRNLLASAGRWMNVRELTGNNDHPMITRAMKLCGLDGNKGYPWCAASQAEIHDHAGIPAPHSARVVDWFQQNVVWEKRFGELPPFPKQGMVGGLYYRKLGRLGHIVLIVGEDRNNYYTLEGNTNVAGSREGDGFYKKVRSKESISALADYCLGGRLFFLTYDEYIQSKLK
jgi:hypothetical protein